MDRLEARLIALKQGSIALKRRLMSSLLKWMHKSPIFNYGGLMLKSKAGLSTGFLFSISLTRIKE
jgi:hypothetical protein